MKYLDHMIDFCNNMIVEDHIGVSGVYIYIVIVERLEDV